MMLMRPSLRSRRRQRWLWPRAPYLEPAIGLLLSILMPALFFGCAGKVSERTNRRSLPTHYVEGSFVVTSEASSSASHLSEVVGNVSDRLGCKANVPEKINWGNASDQSVGVLSEQLDNTYNIRLENCDFSRDGTQAILAELAASEGILNVEVEARAAAVPSWEDDPLKNEQDHLRLIRRDDACKLADTNANNEAIVVAVIDSGVDIDHPDLQGAFLRDEYGEIVGANFVGSGASMPSDRDFDDGHGHGSHVAGIIAASAANKVGGVGVASCANIKIMPVRVLDDSGAGKTIEIERGIKWAADHGAHIINLSLGYSVQAGYQPNFHHALYAALAARDVAVFAAAGNDGYRNGSPIEDNSSLRQWHFPSSYDHVISVAATNNLGSLTSFSNHGDRVDLAAPGSKVLSTTFDGSFGYKSGTSMATPVAAGAYALALAIAKPGLSAGLSRIDLETSRELLKAAIVADISLPTESVLTGGVLDAAKLAAAARDKFPASNLDTDGSTPSMPIPDQQTSPMSFAEFSAGQALVGAQTLKVTGLPEGTNAVYFYWGKTFWSFSKAYVESGQSEVTDQARWYLYGDRTLTALAYDKDWSVIGVASVDLRGL